MAMMLLISCLAAVSGVSSSPRALRPRISGTAGTEEACPPCELLFSKLERTGKKGKLSQHIRVQERGEPKSGTGVAYFWATAGLIHACHYLEEHFGEGSCRFDSIHENENDGEPLDRYPVHSIVFEPRLGRGDSKCSCDTIKRYLSPEWLMNASPDYSEDIRVSIIISSNRKHLLPVTKGCAFARGGGTGIGKEQYEGIARDPPCTFADGTRVKNHDELWRCMHEANCRFTDDWIQMSVFRDPRPTVVSTFYHVQVRARKDLGDLEAFVVRELPIVCQWLAVRYILFTSFLADQSMEFWYNDAMADPLGWHYHWFHSVGLQLPPDVVEAAAQAAAADDLDFDHKDVDLHPGENKTNGERRFEDEVSPEVLAIADDVLRTWLTPALLERFGVAPR